MRGSRFRVAAAAGVAIAGAIGIAVALAVPNPNVKGTLSGYQEVPAISSDAGGSFEAKLKGAGPVRYELRYRGVPEVTQAHLHFGQRGVNGGISIFLCSNLGNGPAGTPECPPPPATITGTVSADDVVGPAAQGIAPGEWDEVRRAIRRGDVYANVHSDLFPSGEIRGQLFFSFF